MGLKDYLDAVRDGWKIVVVFFLLALIVGGIVAFTQTAKYNSTTQLYVAAQVEPADPDELSERNAVAQQRALSYVQVINGDVLAKQISRETGWKVCNNAVPATGRQDCADVSVSVVPGTVIIEIAVVAADADRARDIASAYADAAPVVVRDLERSDAGGWDVAAKVIDQADIGKAIGVRSPALILILSALIGLGAGLATAALWWAIRRELSTDQMPVTERSFEDREASSA